MHCLRYQGLKNQFLIYYHCRESAIDRAKVLNDKFKETKKISDRIKRMAKEEGQQPKIVNK